jgi:YD repeat-containing protein
VSPARQLLRRSTQPDDRQLRDTNNNVTTTLYDLASHVIAVVDANAHRITNIYDAGGRRTVLVNSNNNRTSFSYDLANRPIKVKDPVGAITTTAYDGMGNAVLRIDARNNRTTFTFDLANRQTGRKYPDGTRVTQVYDVMGNRTLMQDATGRYTATFDPLNRTNLTVNPAGKRITYVFDPIGQREGMFDPDGGRFTYVFGGVTSIAYDNAGGKTLKQLANGARTSFTLDNASWLARIVHLKSTNTTISSFAYQYDKTTHRTGVIEASGDRVTWTYDNAYQLTHEQRSGVNSYNVTHTFDPAGSRIIKDTGSRTSFVYDPACRLSYSIDGTGRTTFTHDANGNQTRQEVPSGALTTNVWDFENKNTVVINPDLSRVTFTWNGDQRRVEKDTATTTQKFVFDGNNILIVTDGSNLTQSEYTLEPRDYGLLISQRNNDSGTWVDSYHHFDALGSTDSLTDSSEVITDTYVYYAFGESLPGTGTTNNPYTFAGELGYWLDPEVTRIPYGAKNKTRAGAAGVDWIARFARPILGAEKRHGGGRDENLAPKSATERPDTNGERAAGAAANGWGRTKSRIATANYAALRR